MNKNMKILFFEQIYQNLGHRNKLFILELDSTRTRRATITKRTGLYVMYSMFLMRSIYT